MEPITITQQIRAINQSIRDLNGDILQLERAGNATGETIEDMRAQLEGLKSATQTLQQFRAMAQLLQNVKA